MDNGITIVSVNTQGLGDKSKRKDVLNFLKSKKYSIYFLQDTHFTKPEENYIRAQWGYQCFFSSHTGQSRGVAILINNNFDFKLLNEEKDEDGNLLVLDIEINNKKVTLINLYAPNRDDPQFFRSLKDRISKSVNPCIIAGDFNLVLNPEIDMYNYKNVNNPNARNILLETMAQFDLIDCWREQNQEKLEYTWFRKNPIKKARLDYFIISENLYTDLDTVTIKPGYRTDHSMIYIKFEFDKFIRGKSYWKMNNSLLKDKEYVKQIKEVIQNVKMRYAASVQDNIMNVNDIPIQYLKLDINDQLFFETLLLEIRGKTIQYSSYKKKCQVREEELILEEIERLEKETEINFDLLDIKKKEIFEIRKKKLEGAFIRSRAKWVNEGEKVSKYFCNLENRNYISKHMISLISHKGIILKEQNDILHETKEHFTKLYAFKETNSVDLNDLCKSWNIPKLSEERKLSLEGNLSYEEMLDSLKRMKNNKSPGNDGFTTEFYKFFWQDIGHFLVRAMNYAYENGKLSATQKQGVITCIPKGNKDKSYLKNWRPITLLNVSYKIASSSLANRLKYALNDIINEDQTGFLPGRVMAENVRLLYDILFYTEKHQIPGMLLLIDFASAFDTVSWEFMFQVLSFFNFGSSFIKWIKTIYDDIESCVIVNGHMSEWFFPRRGCRQGDPLSPYLFVLCAEVMSILLRHNDQIKGITIDDVEYLLSQYADDTTLILDGSARSLCHSIHVLKFYAEISGLNINMDKTKVVWIGSKIHYGDLGCEELNLTVETGVFTILGIKFSTDLSEMIQLNYGPKIDEIRKLLAVWKKRILTPFGKLVVIKSLAVSKLTHLFLSIPTPSSDTIKDIQNLFYSFLWDGKKDKIKRQTVIQNYKMGGIRMIDVESFIQSLKITWLRRIIKMKTKYLNLIDIICPFINYIPKFGVNYLKINKNSVENKFWYNVIESYITFADLLKPENWSQFCTVQLWYNPSIKVGGSSVFYKNWYEGGIIHVNDLLDEHGNLFTFQKFKDQFNIKTNFLEYEGLISTIRKYINKIKIIPHSLNRIGAFHSYLIEIIMHNSKGCRMIYDYMTKKEIYPNSLNRWKNEQMEVTNFKFEKIYSIPYKVTKDPKLLWLQCRINHRILGTNYLLTKMKILNSNKCTFCNNNPETIEHIFWTCDKIQEFWSQLASYIEQKCSLVKITWKETDILFGNLELDIGLNKIILLAKMFIYQNKMKLKCPVLNPFKYRIIDLYKTEKYIARTNMKTEACFDIWSRYLNICDPDM